MQPVLEILKLGEHSYTYTVHATRPTGAPAAEACYVDRGLPSFVECLRDAAEALTYFARVHVRFQGRCVGEQLVSRLESQPEAVVRDLLVRYLEGSLSPLPPPPAPQRTDAAQASVLS
ncbi:hypothetical protein VAR608DRAFT_5223 [Variovorax sp. HW608]|uniref:hypothetical protein n=1 Tax=Variovorax sp. HW608 TaxID=1034889 RepID=UPI00081F95ED|nr:hypothetical protein [Variovorax sp. HW608]SCK51841.1 hypothetical protein VAR608DRAFT_5223 [Variovorax sp. HW608]